jgi:WXG100 family type VII secretion target
VTQYEVDVEVLDDVERQMQSYICVVEESLSRVESVIATVSGSWDGAGGAAYQARHRQWVEALAEMKEQLAGIRTWSSDAAKAYRNAVATNLRMASG